MYNLGQTSASQQNGAAATPIAVFLLEIGHEIIPTCLELHYCPNTHPYPREVAVPFFSAPEHHLIALRANGTLGGTDLHILLRQILLIPMVRLTSYIDSSAATAAPTRYIPWNNWGSVGTQRVPDTTTFQNVLSGSRFIPRPYTEDLVDVWDFCRAGVTFGRYDREALPCVREQLEIPSQITGKVVAMISEDAIVICEASSIYLPPMVQKMIRAHCDAISPMLLKIEFISSFSRVPLGPAGSLEHSCRWGYLFGIPKLVKPARIAVTSLGRMKEANGAQVAAINYRALHR
jgi:hypothetical protein